jgi:ParB family transcriptional regulator, chromosome partitioning protein
MLPIRHRNVRQERLAMTKEKPRLGKGLDALFGNPALIDPLAGAPTATSTNVAVARIQLNPHQPRKTFADDELEQLAESIRTHGVLTPVLVRPHGDDFQLIAGERRLRAAQKVGLTEIPVHVRALTDQQVLEAALVENIQRADLNPIEKAQGFKDYLDKFQMTQEQLAGRLGLDRTTISNLLGLLNLVPEVQEYVRLGQLTLGHAKVLKAIPEPDRQAALAKEVIAKNLSVHSLEELSRTQKGDATAELKERPAVSKTNHVQSIEDELRQKLATRVAIKLKSKEKGQIVLQFDSNDDFERILEVLRR